MSNDPASSGFSRRALLRGGLASIALLTVAGVGLALQKTRLRAMPKSGLRMLTLAEYSILAAIAERMCPRSAPGVPGSKAIDVALYADRMLEYVDKDVLEGTKLGLGLIESGLAGAFFFERTKPFTQLSPEDQDRVLLACRESKVALRRTLFRSFAALTGSFYFGDPQTWPSIGYSGPPSPQGLRQAYAAQLVDYQALRAKPKASAG